METNIESPYKLLCTACLCFGRNQQPLREEKLNQCYLDIIKEIPLYNTRIQCPSVCLECSALLRKVVSFREQVQDSYRILQAYTNETLTEFLLTDVSRPPKLRVHSLDPIDIIPAVTIDSAGDKEEDLKMELKNEFCEFEIEENEIGEISKVKKRNDSMKDAKNTAVSDNFVCVKIEPKDDNKEDETEAEDILSDCPLSDQDTSQVEDPCNMEKELQTLLADRRKKRRKRKRKNEQNEKIMTRNSLNDEGVDDFLSIPSGCEEAFTEADSDEDIARIQSTLNFLSDSTDDVLLLERSHCLSPDNNDRVLKIENGTSEFQPSISGVTSGSSDFENERLQPRISGVNSVGGMKESNKMKSSSAFVNATTNRTSIRGTLLVNKRKFKWKKRTFESKFTGEVKLQPPISEFETPLQFFQWFFDDDLLKHITEEIVKFSIQKDPTKPFLITVTELKKFLH